MAKKVTVQIIDDLTGAVVDEADGRTVDFAFDGSSYEIDLSGESIARFRSALEPYIAAARPKPRKTGGSTRQSASASSPHREELQAIREWAHANGVQVSKRGRIAATVREAYLKAQP